MLLLNATRCIGLRVVQRILMSSLRGPRRHHSRLKADARARKRITRENSLENLQRRVTAAPREALDYRGRGM